MLSSVVNDSYSKGINFLSKKTKPKWKDEDFIGESTEGETHRYDDGEATATEWRRRRGCFEKFRVRMVM